MYLYFDRSVPARSGKFAIRYPYNKSLEGGGSAIKNYNKLSGQVRMYSSSGRTAEFAINTCILDRTLIAV